MMSQPDKEPEVTQKCLIQTAGIWFNWQNIFSKILSKILPKVNFGKATCIYWNKRDAFNSTYFLAMKNGRILGNIFLSIELPAWSEGMNLTVQFQMAPWRWTRGRWASTSSTERSWRSRRRRASTPWPRSSQRWGKWTRASVRLSEPVLEQKKHFLPSLLKTLYVKFSSPGSKSEGRSISTTPLLPH